MTTLLCLMDRVVTHPGRTCPGDNGGMLRLRQVEDAGKGEKPRAGILQTAFQEVLGTTLSDRHQYPHFTGEETEARRVSEPRFEPRSV